MKVGAARLGSLSGDRGDALNLDVIFSDDAGGQGFGGKGAGGTSCAFDIEERDGLSIGRECRRANVAMELGETNGGAAVEMREEEIGLL